jgi:hypothetical protein
MIVSPKAAQAAGENFGAHPVCAGPFKALRPDRHRLARSPQTALPDASLRHRRYRTWRALSRIIWGARASLLAGLVSVSIALAVGMPLRLVSGYQGGSVDGVLMRMIAAMLAIPFLILAIALAAFLGPNLINAMIAIGVSQMLVSARLARAQVLAAKQKTMSRRRAPSTTRICASWRGTSSPMSFRRSWSRRHWL